MKPRSYRSLPQSLVICFAPLLACATAHASVATLNESNGSGVWALPLGTNLLAGSVPLEGAPVTHEGSSNIWGTLTDGSLGDVGGTPATSVTPNNTNVVTFPLDLTSKPGGYNITSFDSYCTWANSGRDNQDFQLQYSTVANPTTFINIAAVNNRTGTDRSTHTRLTDTTGFLAMGVHSIRIIFANNQENGYTGFREFVVQDAPVVAVVNSEANNLNNFFVPGGVNLLAGRTPLEAAPAVHEGSSPTWDVVTDGSVGDYTDTISSVTPNNNDTLTFPLDVTAKPAGYDITSFDSFSAWSSNGRDDQRYLFSYSTVADPTVFIPYTTVVAHTEFNGPNARRATHSRITGNGGPIATGVHSVRLTFQNQENGFTGFREFVLKDAPIVRTIAESNNTNSWTLPAGTNLLSAATSVEPPFPANFNHGNNDVTGSTWGILTDGSIGSAGVQAESVAPLDNTSAVFTLDTSVNTKGYNLTSFDSYAAWGDSGRDNQDFTILYSTVTDPTVFLPIETVSNHTTFPTNATHSRITPTSGFLATNVGAVKFFFNNQENGYVGYRQFVLLGNAVPLFSPLTWAGLSGSGGNASWISGSDNNWKDAGVTSPYNSNAPLTFNNTGVNTNITLPAAITANSLTFANDAAKPYTFSGQPLTVTNGLTVSGAGNVTFGNSVQAAGFTQNGTGTLRFSTDNNLTGSSIVSSGVLTLGSNGAMGASALTLTGGTANFLSPIPVLNALSGTGGTVVLGNTVGSVHTDLYVGDSSSRTFSGNITNASATATGSLVKAGAGTLTLAGTNSYTGVTTVNEGVLKFAKRQSLYNGNTASWTATNLQVYTGLTLNLGGADEFTSADIAALKTGGFQEGAVLGLDTTSGSAVISDPIGGAEKILKLGLNVLTLTAANTFTGGITVGQGGLQGGIAGGKSFPSDLTVGNITFDASATTLADEQFGPDSLLKFDVGAGAVNGKFNLRGTTQTVAGVESPSNSRLAIIQNDETTTAGFTTNPGPATLTINTPADSFHSFRGLIRNQDGDSLSIVKNGLGTQEFINSSIASSSYNGATTINEGTLRLNFISGTSGFGSNITVAAPALLNFRATGGNYAFNRMISGPGKVLVDGFNAVILTNGKNAWTGGTLVDGGFLALATSNGGDIGAGDGPGQTSVGGIMDPSNVIDLINTATLSLDNAAPLGNSTVLPQYAPSIRVNEGSRIFGGTNSVAFISNVTLDGGRVEISGGAATGGFNTNLAFVGTVVVGGTSVVPSEVVTVGTGDNANASLGSVGLPGTTFQVANVTGDTAADLSVNAILKDVSPNNTPIPSPLVKTGPGTMVLSGVNTYTGDTTVIGGILSVSGTSIADTNKLVLNGGKLGLDADETVNTLFYAGVQQSAGTYGSTASTATNKDDARFTGTAVLTVLSSTSGGGAFEAWAMQIPDPTKRDRASDPDNDGFSNLQEFLFGTAPTASNGSISSVTRSGGSLIIRWNQRASGTGVYTLQESSTLADPWGVSPAPVTDAAVQDLPDYVRKEATVAVDAARKFLRIMATE